VLKEFGPMVFPDEQPPCVQEPRRAVRRVPVL
jgi:hypothetical protein